MSSAMGGDGPHKSYTRLASPVLYFEGRGKILFSFNTCNGSSDIWRKKSVLKQNIWVILPILEYQI